MNLTDTINYIVSTLKELKETVDEINRRLKWLESLGLERIFIEYKK